MSGATQLRTNPPGTMAERWARSFALGGDAGGAAAFASGQNWNDATPGLIQRAAVAPFTGDQIILPAPISTDFISVMRPLSLLDRIPGLRRVPLNVSLLAGTGGAVGHMTGPNRAKPISAASLARVTLLPAKASATVVVTRELLLADGSDLAIITDLARAVAAALDVAFIDPETQADVDNPGS